MKYLCSTLLFCLLFACQRPTNPDWKTIDYGVFKLKAPPEWKKLKMQGFDSYVGGLTNGKDTLTFDYGWYSPHVELDSSGSYQEDTINGLTAVIGISGYKDKQAIAVEIYLKDKKNKFFIGGDNLSDLPVALKIFKTIHFPYGDTTVNSPLTMEKFRVGSLRSGSELYDMYCINCHHPNAEMIGPPFEEILQYRDADWIYKFLTSRESVKPDSLTLAYRKKAGDTTCVRFPERTKIEIERILHYVR